ncbi:MAG TPA: PPK2 family polyphosphate kinase [Thermoplasmata archaeon]|nr:PPK2 family polyphosphate kinase [Thermoplasmata archaeon]
MSPAFQIPPGAKVRLRRYDPADTAQAPGGKGRTVAESKQLVAKLDSLQELFYACRDASLLVVLQALDTGGKDGTIRHVFEGVNPQGVRVAQFRVPTPIEAAHDFLWRVHAQTPSKGEIVIFNRSQYEDVLAARVDKLVPKHVWRTRYRSINDFERTLVDEGTTVLKFFLYISEDEQRRRLEDRLADPTKHWKFSAADVRERPHWPEYTAAIEEMLSRTSTPWAPWYLIPANKKWFRDWAVSRILVDTLEGFHLEWPKLPRELRSAKIPA